MVAAIDLRALGTTSHIGRETSIEEVFADTFDQAVTLPESGIESFPVWAIWFGADAMKVHTEGDIMLGLLAFCPFFSALNPDLRLEARYEVMSHMFGSEEAYLSTL